MLILDAAVVFRMPKPPVGGVVPFWIEFGLDVRREITDGRFADVVVDVGWLDALTVPTVRFPMPATARRTNDNFDAGGGGGAGRSALDGRDELTRPVIAGETVLFVIELTRCKPTPPRLPRRFNTVGRAKMKRTYNK